MIVSRRQLVFTSVSVALLLMAGCATKQTVSERNFGAAVRQMINAQIYDPKAAQNPDPEPVKVLDGEHASQILEIHRQHVAKPEEIHNEIQINVGR